MSDKTTTPNKDPVIELNIEHAKAAYDNAQDVIKFVDTKTGVMTGVLTITTGIPLAVFHFVVSHKSDEAATIFRWLYESGRISAILTCVSAAAMCFGFVFGVASLLAATSGLMARRPRRASHKEESLWREVGSALVRTFDRKRRRSGEEPLPPVTCLFPLYPPHRKKEALENFNKLARGGYREADVLQEYAAQLESVGNLLETKISRNRQAVHFFECQIAAYMLSSLLSVALILAYPDSQPKKIEWDPREPGHAKYTVPVQLFC